MYGQQSKSDASPAQTVAVVGNAYTGQQHSKASAAALWLIPDQSWRTCFAWVKPLKPILVVRPKVEPHPRSIYCNVRWTLQFERFHPCALAIMWMRKWDTFGRFYSKMHDYHRTIQLGRLRIHLPNKIGIMYLLGYTDIL